MLGDILRRVHEQRPLTHCISNHVTSNDCANLLLACGASPIMADAPEEAGEITTACKGLVLNLGTPSAAKAEAMLRAGKAANALDHPVVFDPVGVGASVFRRDIARELLRGVKMAIIRGNANEIAALTGVSTVREGVDSPSHVAGVSVGMAQTLAKATDAVVALTGDTDIVTDGQTTYVCRNGHPMMKSVTGAGCMLSALTGAYVGANPEQPLQAALAAVCAMGVCGELAYDRLTSLDSNATYRNYIIDAMYRLTAGVLEERARYEII